MVEKIPTAGREGWWPEGFEPFHALGSWLGKFFSPQADAGSTDKAYEIELELPGVDEKDIEVTVDDNVLTVKGEKRSQHEKKGKTYYFSERTYGAFQRSFRLAGDVDADHIDAAFNKGILTIRLPKRADASETAKRIEIKSA